LQISTTRVSPPSCVAPRSTSVVRPLTSSMRVPILVSKGESVVTLASSSICESTAETVVVVAIVVLAVVVISVVVLPVVVLAIVVLAIVVLSVVVMTIVVLAIVVLSIVVAVVVAVVILSVVVLSIVVLPIVVLTIVVAVVILPVVVIVITAAATVVASPTKEEPFISSILPVSCLSPLPAIVAGTGSTTGKEEPGLTVLSLPFATFAARVPVVEVTVVQGSSDCRSKYCCSKGS